MRFRRRPRVEHLPDVVAWHDVECSGYDVDLPLWRGLADVEPGPILDVGAGTGRVTLDLVARGHEVVALDAEPELLRALAWRARSRRLGRVITLPEDARSFVVSRVFGLVIVPMQTVQLLGGRQGRARFLATAREHMRPGAMLAIALADALEGVVEGDAEPPVPDVREFEGVVYASRPVTVRREDGGVAIERFRERVALDGEREESVDVIHLDSVSAAELAAEAAPIGFSADTPRTIPATDEYVGSTVVMLRA